MSSIAVSIALVALSMNSASWSSCTSTASVDSPVANLNSSSAWVLVGLEIATNSLLPRLNSGAALSLPISFSSTSENAASSVSMTVRSNTGRPNSCDEIIAMTLDGTILFCTR